MPVTAKLAPVVGCDVPLTSTLPPIVVNTGVAVAEPENVKFLVMVVMLVIVLAPLPLMPRL